MFFTDSRRPILIPNLGLDATREGPKRWYHVDGLGQCVVVMIFVIIITAVYVIMRFTIDRPAE